MTVPLFYGLRGAAEIANITETAGTTEIAWPANNSET